MPTATKKVVVVGQGYVGLPLAVRAVEAGRNVVGLDVDEMRVKRLAGGESFAADVTSPRLLAALNSGRYALSTDYADAAGFDVCVITVPTPLKDGAPDLSFVESAAQEVAQYLRPNATVILESTTYPCTTEHVVCPILEAGSGLQAGKDFFLGYSPERIDPGNPTWRLENTPKVVSGMDDESLRHVELFYDDIVDRTVPVSSPRTAELTKLLENTFRHVNIALVNELAMFCKPLGIDIWEVIDAASTKPFGFMRFLPGPGVGGHCLPIDPSYLSWQVKQQLRHDFRFVALANDINSHMPDHVVLRVARGSTPGASRSTAARFWSSGSPTRGTPATSVSPLPSRSPSDSGTWALTSSPWNRMSTLVSCPGTFCASNSRRNRSRQLMPWSLPPTTTPSTTQWWSVSPTTYLTPAIAAAWKQLSVSERRRCTPLGCEKSSAHAMRPKSLSLPPRLTAHSTAPTGE